MAKPWVGIDFDKTFVELHPGDIKRNGIDYIGRTLPIMVQRAKDIRARGFVVKIFTARADEGPAVISAIKKWSKENIGVELEVTNVKDKDCVLIIDDKAVQAIPNTGMIMGDIEMALRG